MMVIVLHIDMFQCTGIVWKYEGPSSWYFITLSRELSQDITKAFGDIKRGWGSLPVEVTLHDVTWKTSIFPDAKRGGYLLPLKAQIRQKTGIKEGSTVSCQMRIIL